MHITIINDCRDDNARGRQCARTASLFGTEPNFIGVANDIEAAGNIIDVLDAVGDAEGVIIVNVAPRQGKQKQFTNGTPFGFFTYKHTLILTTIDGLTLSLVKKFALTQKIQEIGLAESVDVLMERGFLQSKDKKKTSMTQFRSYDFLPYAAHSLTQGVTLPGKTIPISMFADCGDVIWWIDSFGNSKTTMLAEKVEGKREEKIATQFGNLPYIEQLRDVPDGVAALVKGSSGLEDRRFVEIVVQGGSAAQKLGIVSGQSVAGF